MDTTDPGDASGSNRRRFLRAGLTGAALTAALPLLARQAAAQDTDDPLATTSVPPRRPTAADQDLLNFAQSVELTARDLYEVALAAGSFNATVTEVLQRFGRHHQSYAQSISATLGPAAAGTRDDALFEALEAAFAGPDALVAAYELEDTAVATHTELLGLLESTDSAALIASIQIVEAQHALVLAELSGAAGLDDLETLLTTQAEALVPSSAVGTDETES